MLKLNYSLILMSVLSMFLVLNNNNFYIDQTKPLVGVWWHEQQRLPQVTYRRVKRTVKFPRWYVVLRRACQIYALLSIIILLLSYYEIAEPPWLVMQIYPVAVVEKAQQVEQLLQRVEQGEILEEVCTELGLEITSGKLEKLQAKYEAGERTWEVLVDGRYGREQKISREIKGWIEEQKRQDIMLTAPKLVELVKTEFGVELNVDYLRYWLRKEGLSRPQGRPSSSQLVIEQEPLEQVVDNVGIFFLEGAKQEMGLEKVVLESVSEACQDNQDSSKRIIKSAESTILCKLDHLLYLPILGLKRPRSLYYYQGDGLTCLYGFTYKYMPLEQFLGELTHLKVGYPMAIELADCYSQKLYPSDSPLFIFVDWHSKPHWTKPYYHSGHVTMWHRIMPGTKQLMVNGPDGWIIIGLNYQIDNHFSNVLVDLEDDLVTILKRPIAYTIVDGEGGGAPLGERYTTAERHYISVLTNYYSLQDFEILNQWQPVTGDPTHEVISAVWADAKKKEAECRQLILMRPVDKIDPTRVYTGHIPADMAIVDLPNQFRKRWANQERRFREMIAGANLNVNYGYAHQKTTNRTRQREQAEAKRKLETSQSKLSRQQEILNNLQLKSAQLEKGYTKKLLQLKKEHNLLQETKKQREQDKKPIKRCQQGINKRERQIAKLEASQLSLAVKITEQQQKCNQLQLKLEERQKVHDEIDTDTLCRERDLEKDQIMFNLQIMLTNLHHWVREHYFAPEWQKLELNKAKEMIYCKSGRVRWYKDRVEVILNPYRYADQQQAMKASCSRFNATNIRWRDGRLLSICVADE